MSFDISALNPSELSELERHAAARRVEIAQEHRAKTIAELTATAKSAGYDVRELFAPPRVVPTKSKRVVRFRDPENTSLTWAGRGKKPKWLQAKVDAGQNVESYRVA